MFCQKCGFKNDDDAAFCNSCGAPLNQTRQKSLPKKHGILFWIAAIIGIFFVVIIVAAIIAAFVFGMASTVNQNSQLTTIPTVPTIPTMPPAPSLDVSANVPSNWVQYTNSADGFSIFKPNDWTVNEVTLSEVNSYSAKQTDLTYFLPYGVYIFNPSNTGFVTIYGADYSGTLYSIFNDQSKTQISDDFYNGVISGLESGEANWESKDGTIQINVTSVERDNTQYIINRNPARRMILNFLVNGHALSGDCYVIAHGDTYYIEFYSAMIKSSKDDASNSVDIMRSLTTNTMEVVSTPLSTSAATTAQPSTIASASVSNSANTSASFTSAGSLYSKSVDLANAGNYKDALEAADAALAQNVSSLTPLIQSNRAGILTMLGRYDEAIAAADVAINTPGGNLNNLLSIAYYNKANALRALGRSAEADANYAHALALNPALKHP